MKTTPVRDGAPTKIKVQRKPANAYQHGDLRPALIQAGLKLLGEGGVAGLSLRAAAQLAGVSHAAPYRHFADKNALVAAIAEEGFRLLTAHMQAEVAKAAPPASTQPASTQEHLLALGLGYVDFAVRHPGYLHVIFGGVAQIAERTPGLAAAADEAYLTLRTAVADGLGRGDLRAMEIDTLALSCWSMMHGLGMLVVDRALPPVQRTPAAARATASALIGILFDGIRAVRAPG